MSIPVTDEPMTSEQVPFVLSWVRHAESQGNVADTEAQRTRAPRLHLTHRDPDMPLSELGAEQAASLGDAWRRNDVPGLVFSSPYERAYRTASIAVERAGWDIEVRRDERLRERDLGMLDGFTKSGIESQFPDEAERRSWIGKFYYRPPGGESWADVAGRVRALLTDLRASRADRRAMQGRVVLVTHQAVILLARYVLEDLTEAEILDIDRHERLANTAVTEYEESGTGWRLRAAADTGHLDEHDATVTDEDDADAVAP